MAIPSITHNSPSAGFIAWGAFTIQLNGVAYSVPAASSNQKWVWWEYKNGAPILNSGPSVPSTLTDDDLVLFANKNGLGVRVQSSNFVDGELLVDGTIVSDALSTNIISSQHIVTAGLDAGVIKFGEMSGDRISVGSLESDRIVVGGGDNTPLLDYVQTEAEDYVKSRGTDLVTNGTGYLGDNTNFSQYTFVSSDAPTGISGSFTAGSVGVSVTRQIDELIPIDPSKEYQYAVWVRQRTPGGVGKFYGTIAPYDGAGLSISTTHYMYQANTLTTLAAPLNPGDTTVKLTSAQNWKVTAGASTHLRSLIFWDYVDKFGKAWPELTYSRNRYSNVYDDGAISGNTITLRDPWDGPAKPAGTKLSNGSAGGTYMYAPSNVVVPEEWTNYAATVTGVNFTGGTSTFATGFPPGTAFVKLGHLMNREDVTSDHAVAGVSFSDAAAANAKAWEAFVRWAPQGVTTINGSNITTGTIDSVHISTTGLDAAVIKFGTMSGDRITANTIHSNHIDTVGLNANVIKFGTMHGDRIQANTLSTNHIVTSGLDASVIKVGTMSGDRITANTLNGDRVVANTINSGHIVTAGLSADVIKFGTMSGDRITAGSLTIGHVGSLQGTLDAKETPTGAQSKATSAQNAAIAAAATDAQSKATAAQTAAISAAAADAQAKANAARDAAISDAAAKYNEAKLRTESWSYPSTTEINGSYIRTGTLAANQIVVGGGNNTPILTAASADAQTKATAAQAAAISDAAAVYGGTKSLVSGWVVSGKTTINGGQIETDSIKAGAIDAGQIDSDHIITDGLDAGIIKFGEMNGDLIVGKFIDGTMLKGEVILASSRIAAEGSEGQSVELNPNGFFVYGPDSEGNPAYVSFPTEGGVAGKPNIISGTLQATTLTVEGNPNTGQAATFRQNSRLEPGASITLSNSIPPPIGAPSLESSTSQAKVSGTTSAPGNEGSGVIYSGEYYFPVWAMAGTNTYTNKIYKVNLTTNTMTLVSSSATFGSNNGVKLISITRVGSTWYGLYYNPSNKLMYMTAFTSAWASTGATLTVTSALPDSTYDSYREAMAITTDGTYLWLATQDGSPTPEGNSSAYIRFRKYAVALNGAALETVQMNSAYIVDKRSQRNYIHGFEVGNMDFGARKFFVALSWTNSQMVTIVTDTNGAIDYGLDFTPQSSLLSTFMAWDGTRFWDVNRRGIAEYWVSKYSRYYSIIDPTTGTTTFYGWYTIYRASDGAETLVSPMATAVLRNRWWLKMTGATPPAGLGLRMYTSNSVTSATSRLQATLPAGTISTTFDIFTNTSAMPPATSGFGSTIASTIQSEEIVTQTVTGAVTSGGTTITGNYRDYMIGKPISGSGIAAGTVINSVIPGTSAVMSKAATTTTNTTATITLPRLEIRGNGYARISELERVVISSTSDVTASAGNEPALRVGDIAGNHMRMDGNEIQSMGDSSSPGFLGINSNGGNVSVGGPLRIGSGNYISAMQAGSTTKSTNSSGQATINHGLGVTPDVVVCTPQADGADGWCMVGGVNSSSFTITLKGGSTNQPLSTSKTYHWVAYKL